jgi:hypothetical protein
MKVTKLLAATALALSMATAVEAAPITGTGAIALFGVTNIPPGGIDVGTNFQFGASLFDTGTSDLASVAPMTLLTTNAITATIGSAVSFTSSFGSFTGVVSSATAEGPAANRAVIVYALGTFTPSGALGSFDAGAMSLTFTANQTGGPTAAVSASYTIASPPAPPPVPEPMSLALFGLGLAGLGVAMRQKA